MERRTEGFLKAVQRRDAAETETYEVSGIMLQKAEERTPVGKQMETRLKKQILNLQLITLGT